MKRLISFLKDEEGVTAIEYSIIAALLAVVIVAAVTAVGGSVDATFVAVDGALTPAAAPAP